MDSQEKMILKSLLTMGADIEFHGLTLINYKLKNIFKDITLLNYYSLINVCTEKPEELLTNEQKAKSFVLFLNCFTNKKWIYNPKRHLFVTDVKTKDELVILNIDNLQYILDVFKMMYCIEEIKNKSEQEDVDDEWKEILKKFEEEEQKVNESLSKQAITLNSIVLGVSCKHPSLNLLNIWDYTVYMILKTYRELNIIDSENRVYSAIYSGICDSLKINLEAMHFANDID